MSYPVVMSLDHTLASHHRGNTFLGFGACLPGRLTQEAFFRAVAWPAATALPDGSIGTADCGSRRIEAALREAGFGPRDFHFAHPDRLGEAVGPDTKVFLFGSHDPLGRGPLARMFHALWGGPPPFNARSVARLLFHPALKKARPVVIAGGGGAWEWATDERARRDFGVDCVLVGEGETTVPELVRRALDGETLPEVVTGRTVPVDRIPRLRSPTAGGVVEATRGCGRGCHFCVPNLLKLRSLPVEHVLEDVAVNIRAGRRRVSLHAEDIFRYGNSGGFAVNEDAVCGLFEAVARQDGVEMVSASHATLAGALAAPSLLRRLAGILGLGRPGRPEAGAFQIGIETGSVSLARRHLAQKMAPFSADDWPEVVRQGAAHLWANRFYAAYTLVVGLPGETDADVYDTLRLVRQLRGIPCVIFPLFFVPMSPVWTGQEQPLTASQVTRAQAALIVAAFEHNAQWADRVWALYGRAASSTYAVVASAMVRALTAMMTRSARRLAMERGSEAGRREPGTALHGAVSSAAPDRGDIFQPLRRGRAEWFPPVPSPPSQPLPQVSQGTGVGCPLPAPRIPAN